MEPTVTLMHGKFKPDKKIIYFYNGLLVAKDGLLSIPLSQPHWIRRAWVMGYNLSPQGERLWTYDAVKAEAEKQTAMSAKEENENPDSGRQSKTKDRVRQS